MHVYFDWFLLYVYMQGQKVAIFRKTLQIFFYKILTCHTPDIYGA